MIKIDNVYIACSLSNVPRDIFSEYSKYIHELANFVKNTLNCEVKYALVDSDPDLAIVTSDKKAKRCYEWDRQMVECADLVVGDATFPSIGLGIELQIAQNNDIPVILTYNKSFNEKMQPTTYKNPDGKTYNLQLGEGYISLMAIGLPNVKEIIFNNGDFSAMKSFFDNL